MEKLTREKLLLLETLHYNINEPSLLIKSIKTNNIDLIEKIIECDVGVGVRDNNNNTPLFIATIYNNLAIVQMLVEKARVPIDEKSYKNHTALTYACKKGYISIVDYLIKKGANKSHITNNGSDGIIYATIYGYIDIIELLLDENTKFIKNIDGNDALIYACIYNRIDIVKLLLLNGGDINTFNNKNETPLQISCQYGHKDLANYLLTSGYNIDYKLNYLINLKTIKELSDRYKWKELLDLFTKKK